MVNNIALIQHNMIQGGRETADSEAAIRQQMARLFWQRQLGTTWHRLGQLMGRSQPLQSLQTVAHQGKIGSRQEKGVQMVPISAIKGSEGRNKDFDASFRPLQSHTQDRWVSVATAWQMGISLPPVDLIRLGDRYFVRDGHHRISVALALGQRQIDARVTEWQPV